MPSLNFRKLSIT
jgi:ribose transport system permease protein